MYGTKKARLLRVEARRRPAAATVVDRSPWDWYAESCSCGLPPGECRAHPRARPSQRPPAGDWRVWGYVAGRGAGKTRAGACWIQHRVEAGVMKLGCLIAPTMADIRDVMVEGPSGLLGRRAAVVPASIRAFETPRHLAQRRPRGLLERRRARARPRVERRHPLGRRAGVLAARRIDLGPGDAGAAGRHQSPGPDHDNAAPRRGPETHPRRGDHRPDDRYHVMPTRPTCRASSSLRSSACMRIPGWAGRRSTPSSSRRPRVSGSPGSTRPGTSRSRPSTTPATTSAARSTPARRGTPRRCSSRSATNTGSDRPRVTVFGDYHALDVVSRKNARRHQGAGRSTALSRPDRPRAARPGGDGSIVTGPGGLLRVRAGVRLADPRPVAAATWFWTGSRPSSCCWKPATC